MGCGVGQFKFFFVENKYIDFFGFKSFIVKDYGERNEII